VTAVATQAQRRAATTGSLLRAARQLFAEHGFGHVAVDDIAAAAGVTRGAFYHHYDSKEALFEVVFGQIEDTLADAVAAAAATQPDALGQLTAGIESYLALASDPRYSRVVLTDAPAVLGQARYEQIEQAHFLGRVASSIAALRPGRPRGEHNLAARALLAAVCALAKHVADHPADLAMAAAIARSLAATVAAAQPSARE
jgi:AcrR family transcriptional regulator